MKSEHMLAFWPEADVRNDPIGTVNKLLNWVFTQSIGLLRRLVSIAFRVELPQVNHPLRMPHPYNIVVNSGTVFVRNVTIYHGVTLGSKRYGSRVGVPDVGDHVVIFPNAIIVGGIRIGAGAIVQPGSVVIDDVPPMAVVAGNPAKIIGYQAPVTDGAARST